MPEGNAERPEPGDVANAPEASPIGDHPGRADPTLRAALWAVGFVAVALTLGAWAGFDRRTAMGTGVGGALGLANLAVLVRVGRGLLENMRPAPWGAVAIAKLLALVGGIGLLLENGVVSPLALAAGYLALPIGITLGVLFGPKPPEDLTQPPLE